MNPIEQLNAYLNRLEARLRLKLLSRGSALAAAVALAATVALVLIANALAFSPGSVAAARVALFLSIALALAFAILIPLLRHNRFRAARAAEEKLPELEQRLLTLAERTERRDDPFLELLASDTLATCEQASPESLVSRGRVAAFASAAAAAAGVLIWLIMAGPGFMGYGAALLWAGPSKAGSSPFYDVVVSPGNRTVRRKADQLIAARLVGFEAPVVRLLARYRGTSKWEEIAMQPQPEGGGYDFLFASVADTLDYYVRAGAVRSPTFTLNVKDLPAVTKLRVIYHYPQWTGMADRLEDPGGDLRAVEGSEAEIAVETDRPLANGILELDTGEQIPLRNGVARLPIKKDGAYHIAALDNKEAIRLTEDYFIAAAKDTAPAVHIERPGRDAKVSPIEEVTIAARADDDFGLQELALHYSVNGGAEKTMPLLNRKGSLDAAASTTLALEDFKLQPGDIVSFYAAARDARQSARTDMYFLQAEPFERSYSQSQQMGGGGEGGQGEDDGNGISARQKEIIAATWNELRGKKDRGTAAENARFLSGVQSTLRDQARSLARRMNSRQLSGANEEFKNFSKYMEQAAAAMDTASGKLRSSDWQSALAPEQQALQNLLRAEATLPRDPGCFRKPRRTRRRRRPRRSGPRPRKPLRPRTRHREESVRDRTPIRRQRTRPGDGRDLPETRTARSPPAGTRLAPAAAAIVPAALAAGSPAPRSRAVAAPHRTAHPRRSGRVAKRSAGRSTGPAGARRTPQGDPGHAARLLAGRCRSGPCSGTYQRRTPHARRRRAAAIRRADG